MVEELLDSKAKDVGKSFGDADTLTLISPIVNGVEVSLREAVESLEKDRKDKLVVILETEGGYIEVVERMVGVLRHHYPKHVSFVIPNFAMSAGTVFAMSGDHIYMDYFSILGPIDPQIPHPNGSRFLPAIGYLEQYKMLMDKATQGTLNTIEAAILVEKFDQAELYQFERARDLSESLLREWLAQYKFKTWTTTEDRKLTVTDDMRRNRATEIANALNDPKRWHSHGRAISADILNKDLKLQIDDFGQIPTIKQAVKAYYRLAVDFKQKHGLHGIVHVPGTLIPVAIAQ